ncbi:hypothetical protein MKX75_11550 [Paenibacillus sp. FSL R5-0341]|uniref:hypothetical protein n=1 Tax=Paenibacillus sp. FSL R5-0341 TaxID=2921636 RepID=UPI0030D14177
MKIEEKLIERFNSLIHSGQRVLSTRSYNEFGDDQVDQELAVQWLSSTENLIQRLFGLNSVHLKRIESIVGPHTYLSYDPSS